jgi:hypothetical protein
MMERKKNDMKWKTANLQTRLYLIAASLLLVGLGSAVLIYLTADNASESVLVSDFLNSKKYIHALRVNGGNMTLLADEFSRWFDGLWHGESLAYTVACITLVTSSGFFFAAYHAQSDSKADPRGDDKRSGSD